MLAAADKAEHFKYIEEKFSSKWFTKYISSSAKTDWDWDPSYGISKEDWAAFMEPQAKCIKCGTWDYDYNLFPTKDDSGATIFFCSDCISQAEDIHWCETCGEPFVDKTLPKTAKDIAHRCKDCRG